MISTGDENKRVGSNMGRDHEAQQGTRLHPFDPSECSGHTAQEFEKFLRLFKAKYIAWDRPPPAGTADADDWKEKDMFKQLRGHYCTDRFMDDIEAVATEAELGTMKYSDMVEKLKARYKPSENTTMNHYHFHRIQQKQGQSFDSYVNEVKKAAKNCSFKCASANCDVKDTLIRDQVIFGVHDEEFRKKALKEQWNITELEVQGRQTEAAKSGAAVLEADITKAVDRLRPGKYARKKHAQEKLHKGYVKENERHKGKAFFSHPCQRCNRPRCNPERCPATESRCHVCKKEGHWASSILCRGKRERNRHTRQLQEESDSDNSDNQAAYNTSSPGTETEEEEKEERGKEESRKTRRIKKVFQVGGVRHTKKRSRKKVKDFKVDVVVNGKIINVTTDTGAEINVMPKRTADRLGLQIEKSRLKLCPYGAKPFRVKGKYEGCITFGETVITATWYILDKRNIEPLLSGRTAESLGIIQFQSEPSMNQAYIKAVSRSQKRQDCKTEYWLAKYPKVFQGVGTLKNHSVKLYIDPDVKPVAEPQRTIPFHLKKRLEKELEQMEKDGIIEDHTGPAPWVSNLVLAPKEEGKIRVTVDMRRVNKAMQNTHVPIPRVEDIKAQLSGSKVFSKLDLKSAYHQLMLEEESRYITVFQANGKLMRYRKLTMGNMIASGELNRALQPLLGYIPNVYLIHDDIIIAAPTDDEHNQAVETVLQTIADSGLTLNPDKCMFGMSEVPFWGVVITGQGVTPDPKKVEALQTASAPRSKEELISFLAMIQSHSEFIPGLATSTHHLRQLTKKHQKFTWSSKHQKEFEDLKESFCKDTLNRYFDPRRQTFVFVDAHQTGLGAILAQGSSIETAKLVAIASRATTNIEQRYPQLDLEGIAVDFGLRRFRQYLVGGPKVKIVTDHKPLVSIFANRRLGSIRLDRVKLRHQDVQFEVIWKAGKSNPADYLSRHGMELHKLSPAIREEANEFNKLCWFLHRAPYIEAITMEKIWEHTEKDKVLRKLGKYILLGQKPNYKENPELRPYSSVFNELTISDGGLILRGETVVLPESLISTAVEKAHQGGHPGETNLKRRLRMHFWFPRLNDTVKGKVNTCRPCQIYTDKTTKEPQAALEVPSSAWDKVALDLFGPMPSGRHILVVQDTLSRFPAASIVPNTKATSVLPALHKIYTDYGFPNVHLSDNGPPFNSEQFQQYSQEQGIKHQRTYP